MRSERSHNFKASPHHYGASEIPVVTNVFIELKAQSEKELEHILTNAIYEYRLYTDVQLQALFDQAQEQNLASYLTAEQIREVCQKVQDNLDREEPSPEGEQKVESV